MYTPTSLAYEMTNMIIKHLEMYLYYDSGACWASYTAFSERMLYFIHNFTSNHSIFHRTGDDELPLSDALIASLVLLLGIIFCLFYKFEFIRIDSTGMIQIRRELTPLIGTNSNC